ncbi:MAG: hypothetical protein AVDCRST_MAG64-4167 [uncultured Phycisphaerae bacterium]|uniref:Uncharacterized protein n=1 Tax=uncultured Phycisphaerae bacterium TaxID=904963 RepID=A0A6J4QGC5_9BACT|nr:MAG: hypothetical protein AVDCRST_MAG64-4167 [uncultured Phycisphaerae bacterium]
MVFADPRRDRGLDQHPVDPVPDPQLVLERLDVDVGRPHLQPLRHDLVDELDDRRVLGSGRRVGRQVKVVVLLDDLDLVVVLGHPLDGVGPDAEDPFGRPVDLPGRRDGRPQLQPGRQPQLVERAGVEHLAGGDEDRVALVGQRQQLLVQQDAGRELGQQLLRRLGPLQLRVRQPELLGQKPQHLLFRPGRLPVRRPPVVPVQGGVERVVDRPAGGELLPRGLRRVLVEEFVADQGGDDVVHAEPREVLSTKYRVLSAKTDGRAKRGGPVERRAGLPGVALRT